MATNQEVGRRIRLFASIQAAHRALAREAHPSELAPLRDEARDLLVRLQNLAGSVASGEAAGDSPGLAAELASVDRVLEAQTARTLQLLASVDFTQLRALAPTLVQKNPEELKGLVDVLLESELRDDKSLRTLEYLITLLSTEERGGRRVVTRDPATLTPRLGERTREWAPTSDVLVAERALENAVTRIHQGAELGEVRDRIRQYKEELGRDILHPPVLVAVVAYNAAMWNQIAAEIESIRSVEDLAARLFEESETSPPASDRARLTASTDALRSPGFARLVTAFGARIHGESQADGPAAALVARLDLEQFGLEDLEAFDSADASEYGWLIRATVVLGCVLRGLPAVADDLRSLEIDPDVLGSVCVDDLREAVGELARKHFAGSNYGEAFRLSELKRRNLGAASRATVDEATSPRTAPEPSRASRPGGVSLDFGILPGQGLWVALAAVVLLCLFLMPSISERVGSSEAMPDTALETVSPFLASGVVHDEAGQPRRFVGQLGPAWSFLGTPERREVATLIGEHFEREGVDEVILVDRPGHTAARYADGAIVAVIPRPRSDGGGR